MLLGPIRYSYTAKEKAKAQGIEHLVYSRFTPIVAPRGVITKKMHPNEAYDIIRNNEVRDDLIIGDIKEVDKSHFSFLNEAREKLEGIIYKFHKAYGLPLPRRYRRKGRKDYLVFAKCKKRIVKKIRRALLHFTSAAAIRQT